MIKPNFSKLNGLMPAVIQESKTNKVLMLAFMNPHAFDLTVSTGYVHFWSRSRSKIWKKGEKSGNALKVVNIYLDCDLDALLIKVKLLGRGACHTGNYSCFSNYYKKGLYEI